VATVWVSSNLSQINDEQCEANAALIAAAPDMLRACLAAQQCITDFLELYRRGCSMQVLDEGAKSLQTDALAKITSALRKAQGDQP
jgi:hypothetical protein